jgi:hypothetical protein
MAQAVSQRLLTAESRVRAHSSSCGVCGGRIALGQVFLEFFGFILSISFHRSSSYSCIMLRMNNRSVVVRSSETKSHPIDMNNNIYSLNYTNCSFRLIQFLRYLFSRYLNSVQQSIQSHSRNVISPFLLILAAICHFVDLQTLFFLILFPYLKVVPFVL